MTAWNDDRLARVLVAASVRSITMHQIFQFPISATGPAPWRPNDNGACKRLHAHNHPTHSAADHRLHKALYTCSQAGQLRNAMAKRNDQKQHRNACTTLMQRAWAHRTHARLHASHSRLRSICQADAEHPPMHVVTTHARSAMREQAEVGGCSASGPWGMALEVGARDWRGQRQQAMGRGAVHYAHSSGAPCWTGPLQHWCGPPQWPAPPLWPPVPRGGRRGTAQPLGDPPQHCMWPLHGAFCVFAGGHCHAGEMEQHSKAVLDGRMLHGVNPASSPWGHWHLWPRALDGRGDALHMEPALPCKTTTCMHASCQHAHHPQPSRHRPAHVTPSPASQCTV